MGGETKRAMIKIRKSLEMMRRSVSKAGCKLFKGLLKLLLFERSLSGAGKQLGVVNDPSYQMLMLADLMSNAPAVEICL